MDKKVDGARQRNNANMAGDVAFGIHTYGYKPNPFIHLTTTHDTHRVLALGDFCKGRNERKVMHSKWQAPSRTQNSPLGRTAPPVRASRLLSNLAVRGLCFAAQRQ